MKEQILWFQDSVKLKSPQRKWGEIDMLTGKLIELIGNPQFEHLVIKPEDCMKNLMEESRTLKGNFSSVIDLGGFNHWTEEFLSEERPVIGRFHISRIRNILSPRLDGNGHLLSMSLKEIEQLKRRVDLTQTLLVDNVGWSGRTILEAAKILSVDPNCTILGFLVANEGSFGEDKPGAVGLLKRSGFKIISGGVVETPRDDGFHLSDFIDNSLISRGEIFDVIIRVQQLREKSQICNEQEGKDIDNEIRRLLITNREALFPNAKSTEEMKTLQDEGRLIMSGGIPKNSFFDTNPPNWLMPSFSRRVSSVMLDERKVEITDTLKRLNDVISLWRDLV
ncbi:MAG: hypothetical protein Q7R49_05350 [Candidatus Daviesbacteria bacterium]|nr:hypothetical protein [Candidatus Daviesbacteria bacterium]